MVFFALARHQLGFIPNGFAERNGPKRWSKGRKSATSNLHFDLWLFRQEKLSTLACSSCRRDEGAKAECWRTANGRLFNWLLDDVGRARLKDEERCKISDFYSRYLFVILFFLSWENWCGRDRPLRVFSKKWNILSLLLEYRAAWNIRKELRSVSVAQSFVAIAIQFLTESGINRY